MTEHSQIECINGMPAYAPAGHSGTRNVRLVNAGENGLFELIHGTIEPGGAADRHCHKDSYQAIFILSGLAEVTLGDGKPRRCGPDTIVRIPPGLDHQVVSLGPDPLRLLVAYAPPLEPTGSKAGDKG